MTILKYSVVLAKFVAHLAAKTASLASHNQFTLKMSTKKTLLCTLCLLASLSHADDANKTDTDWHTLSTPSFRIYYQDQNYSDVAEHVASIYQSLIADYEQQWNWQPDPIHVVLHTDKDFSNGFAIPFARNTNQLFLAPPLDELADRRSWLEMLIAHELTHSMHLDKAEGNVAAGRNIFGRFILLFPNLFAPTWMIEGIAVVTESDLDAGFGRGGSGYFDAIIRVEAQKGFKSFGEISFGSDYFYPDGLLYVYGYYFYRHLIQTYGESRVQNFFDKYSANLIPFRVNKTFRREFGQSVQQLWANMLQELESEFADPGTPSRSATLALPQYSGGAYALGTDSIYYVKDNGYTATGIYQLQQDGSEDLLHSSDGHADIDYHPQSGLLINELGPCFSQEPKGLFAGVSVPDWEDNKSYDADKHRCTRLRHTRWHPSGRSYAGIGFDGRQMYLARIDQGGEQQRLYTAAANSSIRSFSWNADGSQIYFVEHANYQSSIVQLDLAETPTTQTLASFGFIVNDLHVHADKLLLIANRDRRFDVYSYDLASGAAQRLSQVLSYAKRPQIDQDGKLVYSTLTTDGLAIVRATSELNASVDLATSIFTSEPAPMITAEGLLAATNGSTKEYSTLDTIAPAWWFPQLLLGNEGYDRYGLMTGGADARGRHRYAANLLYYNYAASDAEHEAPSGLGGYFEYSFGRMLTASAEREFAVTVEDQFTERSDSLELRLQAPFGAFIATERNQDRTYNLNDASEADRSSEVNGVGVLFDYSDRRRLGISPLGGGSVNLGYSYYPKSSDSYAEGELNYLTLEQYLRLYHDQSLGFSLTRAYASSEAPQFSLGGNATPSQWFGDDISQTSFGLAGYQEGELQTREFVLGESSYYLPLADIATGTDFPPVGIGRSGLRLYSQYLDMENSSQQRELYRNVGLESVNDLILFYNTPMLLSLGYVQALDESDSVEADRNFYLKLEMAMEEGF